MRLQAFKKIIRIILTDWFCIVCLALSWYYGKDQKLLCTYNVLINVYIIAYKNNICIIVKEASDFMKMFQLSVSHVFNNM